MTGETLDACRAALAGDRLDWLRRPRRPHASARCAARRPAARPGLPPRARPSTSPCTTWRRGISASRSPTCSDGRTRRCRRPSRSASSRSRETLAEAEEYVGRGFRVLKVKIGDSLDLDLERLAKLRERLGADVAIRVDANIGYTIEETARFFERTAPLAIEFVEQPVPREAFEEIRTLSAAAPRADRGRREPPRRAGRPRARRSRPESPRAASSTSSS